MFLALCSELEAIQSDMLAICDHIGDLVGSFGATSAFMAWIGPDLSLHMVRTGNIHASENSDFWPMLTESFRSECNKVSGMSTCVLNARLVRLLLFQGCSPNAAVVKAGWNNKKTCIQRRMERVRGLTESPVYISVSGKYGFTWKHPQGSTELDRLDDFFHHHCMGMKFRAMSSLPGPVSPQIKRRKAPENRRAPNYSRKRLKTWDGEPLLRPGSLEWYEDQLRNPLVVPVQPLCRHERAPGCHSLSWACVDSRAYGRLGETLHHGLLVKVTCPDSRGVDLECTCDTFTAGTRENGDCVHVQYISKHLETFKKCRFGRACDVIQIQLKNKECVGYYHDNAFVKLDTVGWRCSLCRDCRRCRHVRTMNGVDQESAVALLENQGMAEPDLVPSPPPGTLDWYLETQPEEAQITTPLREDIRESIQRIHHAGLAAWTHPKPGGKHFPALTGLRPPKPRNLCHCQQEYDEVTGLQLDYQSVRVFLNPSRYDCIHERPVYRWVCPNRKPECTVPYTGVHDGLWRVSSTMVVELQMMYDAYNSALLLGAQSLESQCDELRRKYHGSFVFDSEGCPRLDESVQPFMDATKFRNAAIQFGKRTSWKMVWRTGHEERALDNPMMCPCCMDSPRVLIMDGTSMSIRSKGCFAQSITKSDDTGKEVPKRWGKRQRAFVNVVAGVRTKQHRAELVRLLDQFQKWIRRLGEPSTESPMFTKRSRLLELGRAWSLVSFLKWAHTNARAWSAQPKRLALADFVRCLASESPVVSYISMKTVSHIKEWAEDGSRISSGVMQDLMKHSPYLCKLLQTVSHSQGHVRVPPEWKPLLKELVTRIEHVTTFPSGYSLERELGSGVEEDQENQVPVLDGSYLQTGILTGLPRLRRKPHYSADKSREDEKKEGSDKCDHAFYKPGDRTGGVFTILCEHGFVYASFIIKEAEGRNEPFTFMTCYLEKAPEYVIYDNACNLQDYCLSRAPLFFMHTKFFVDAFHWVNHKACSLGYSIKAHEDSWLKLINTQVAEQNNAALKNLKSMMSRMSQKSFMTLLKSFMCYWNFRKLEKLNAEEERRRRRNGLHS